METPALTTPYSDRQRLPISSTVVPFVHSKRIKIVLYFDSDIVMFKNDTHCTFKNITAFMAHTNRSFIYEWQCHTTLIQTENCWKDYKHECFSEDELVIVWLFH